MWAHVNYNVENSLMEKKASAVELIKVRLSEMPNDPRLWYVSYFFCLSVYYILNYIFLSNLETLNQFQN